MTPIAVAAASHSVWVWMVPRPLASQLTATAAVSAIAAAKHGSTIAPAPVADAVHALKSSVLHASAASSCVSHS